MVKRGESKSYLFEEKFIADRGISIFAKMVTLVCYRNGVIVCGKKGITHGGPPPVATFIRSRATFHEFMGKLY